VPVERGITLDTTTQHTTATTIFALDPVVRWDVKDTGDGEQIEVWPVPAPMAGAVALHRHPQAECR
jgi:hypothetical protein